MKILRPTLLFFALVLFLPTASSQYIDSVHINSQVQPDEFFVNIEMRGGGKLFTRIDEGLNGDTVEFDIYFTRCYGAPNVFYEDTLLKIQSQNVPIEYNLKITTYYDTNSVDTMNCLPFSSPWPIDTFMLGIKDIDFSTKAYNLTSGFTMYPNPIKAGETLSIDFKEKSVLDKILIYTMDGRPVKAFNGSQSRILLDNLTPGKYLIEIRCGNSQYWDNLVIDP